MSLNTLISQIWSKIEQNCKTQRISVVIRAFINLYMPAICLGAEFLKRSTLYFTNTACARSRGASPNIFSLINIGSNFRFRLCSGLDIRVMQLHGSSFFGPFNAWIHAQQIHVRILYTGVSEQVIHAGCRFRSTALSLNRFRLSED